MKFEYLLTGGNKYDVFFGGKKVIEKLPMKEISAGVWDHGEVNKYKWNGKRWQKVRALPETDNNTGKALERNKFLTPKGGK